MRGFAEAFKERGIFNTGDSVREKNLDSEQFIKEGGTFMRRMKMLSKRAGAVFLSVTMLTTVVSPEMIVKADSQTSEADYSGTPQDVRTITTKEEGKTGTENTWNIVWSDEFNGTELDTTKWSYMIGTGSNYAGDGWGNNEQQYYTDGGNAEVTEGNLVITAKKEEMGGKDYTSARLWTMDDSANPGGEKTGKFTKTYGRIESRIKIKNQADNMAGIWPAFWMMPAYDEYGTWACSGELDIMEARGSNKNSVDGTIHYGSQWPNNKSNGGSLNKPTAIEGSEWADFSYADYHTYAVEWIPGEIRWYVDDVLYYRTSNWYSVGNGNAANYTYPAPFDQDFYILLNLAVGGNYDNNNLDKNLEEAKMYVDYVRVYDLDGGYDDIEAVKPSGEADKELVSGKVGDNYVESALENLQTTTDYPSESDKTNWFLSNLAGGAATGSMEEDALKINITDAGTQDYAIQLIHNVPLTKGWRYEMTFKAKADAAMTLKAKFGNISGYPPYSDTYDVNLGTEWKEYKYVFDMPTDKASDIDGRIEFNMNYNTGNVYFKDFVIKSTGQTPEIDADAAKEPLSNGNHVYNGTFDQGDGGIGFWHASENTTIKATKEKDLEVVGTDAASGIFQKGMNLLQGDSYKVEFDAKANDAGDISVKLLSADGTVEYANKTVSVTTDYTSEKYAVEFTMPDDKTDTEGIIEFVTGNKTAYLDNISMIRTTNNNVDWDGITFYPVANYDFYDGATGWNIWQENAWFATDFSGEGMLLNTSIPENGNPWCVGMETPAIDFKAGIPYKLIIDIGNVDLNGPDEEGNGEGTKTLRVKLPGSEATTDYTFNAGTNEPLEIPVNFASDTNGKVAIHFGANSATEYGSFSYQIKSIDVVVDEDKLEVPEEHKKLRSASITSNGDIKEGQDAVVKHNNDTWASKITAAYVNGKAIDAALIDTSENGLIKIDTSVVAAEGSYAIKFDAEGYESSATISQKVLSGSGSVIVNGDFSSGNDPWTFYGHNGCGSFAATDGVGVIDFKWHEGEGWHQQLNQAIAVKEAGNYLVSFDAYATIERPIIVCVAAGSAETQKIVDITTEKKTYYVPYMDLTTATDKFGIWTGQVAGKVDGSTAHKIYIDNVKMVPATQEELDAVSAPEISATGTSYVGNNVILSYTQNSVWDKKELTVTVNGTQVDSEKVQVNTAARLITIDSSVFTEAGAYTISVAAEGYDARDVQIYVAADRSNILPEAWDTVWKAEAESGTITTKPYGFDVEFAETLMDGENPQFWSMQAKLGGFQTTPGKKYVLTFDAELTYTDESVTDERELTLEFGSNANQPKISIKPGTGSYEYEIEPGANGAYYVMFMPGGTSADVKAHTLSVSNIKFAEKAVEGAEEPVILAQPKGAAYAVGATASALNVAAMISDGGTLSYQWYQNTENSVEGATAIEGATETSYTPSTAAAGTTYYFCKVTNTKDEDTASVNSAIVEIKVNAETGDNAEVPTITTQPVGATYTAGATAAALTVEATVGEGTLSYQWYKNTTDNTTDGTAIPEATDSSYLPVASEAGTTYYYCIVTNTNNAASGTKTATATTNTAAIVVNATVPPKPTTYTVTFNSNGGTSVAAQTVEAGKTAKMPTAPTRSGYTFAGWYNGATAYNFNTPVNSNLTLTAKWTANNQGGNNQGNAVKVTKVKITGDSKKIAAGKKITLKANVTPATATNKKVKWKSSNTKYATVSQSGVVTTKKAGAGKTVTITATAQDGSNKKATYKITIMNKAVKKVKLTAKTKTVKAGKKLTVKASVTLTGKIYKKSKSTKANKTLAWKSSNKKYATVNSKGVVSTKKAGKGKTVTITATATDGSKKKATIKIKLTK